MSGAGWGLFLWDSTVPSIGSNSWTWNVSGCSSTYQSIAIELLGAPAFLAYKYVDGSNYVDISNENGWVTRQIYDGLGRLSIVDRLQSGISYSNVTSTYDLLNNMDRQSDPIGNSIYYQYDTTGRLLNVTKPDRTAILQTYNDFYGWVRFADEFGKYRCGLYDRLGRLISVYENASATCQTGILTTYYYDEIGDLVRVTNAYGYSTTNAYDNLGRLTGINKPDGTSETYTYDRNGNLIQKIDSKNTKTLYSYDSLNRPKTVTLCGTPITSISYSYDKNSNVLTVQNQNATITYSYDFRNRPLIENYDVNLSTRPVVDLGCSGTGGTSTTSGGAFKSYKVTYSYSGEVLSRILYPTTGVQNIAATYTYDALGRMVTVSAPYAALARFAYSTNDEIKSVQYGNGLTMNYTYDVLDRILVEQLNNTSLHTNLLKLSYTYNATGTVSSVVGRINGVTVNEQYKYDALQRLTNSTVASQGVYNKVSYTYDNIGNRLNQNMNGTLTSYVYTLSNSELASSSTPSTSSTYGYDANGNLVSKSVTNGGTVTWTYTWDAANRLLAVSNGTIQGKYAYDSDGRLVESIERSSNAYFAYKGTEMLWQNETDFIFANDLRIARISSSSNYQTPFYYHPDQLGSVRLVTKNDGTIYFSDSYQPFGQDNGTSLGTETYKFTGKPVSQTTGLYYEYQRWYDPTIGRFISRDPLAGHRSNPQSLNPYIYVLDTPTSVTDPSGENPWYIDLLESLGPENDVINIAEHVTGVNLDQLAGTVGGSQAQDLLTASRVLSGGAFLASGIVAAGAIVAPIIGIGGSSLGAGAASAACEQGGCQDAADLLTTSGGEALTKGATEKLANTAVFWNTAESSNFWSVTRQGSRILNPFETMAYHYGTHIPADFDISAGEYTSDALSLRNLLWDTGREVPFRSFGGTAWKITTPWGPGGIYTLAGKIISFWYEED